MTDQKNPPTEAGFRSIIIVGAGPSGLLLALLLLTLSPPPKITILDAASTLDTAPRATHYGPPAIHALRRAGILPRVRARGFMPSTICWRKLDGTRIAGLDRGLLHGDGGEDADGTTVLPVGELGQLMLEALGEKGLDVRWGRKVVDVGNEGNKAWVIVEKEEQEEGGLDGGTRKEKYEADFVIGCDGGGSGVRRCLFKGEFPGFTWDKQIVATNTYIDLDQFAWSDTQFIIHPEHWYMAARISLPSAAHSNKSLWRISYGEPPHLTASELLARQPQKFAQMLPGHPSPDTYTISSISPYKIHQRCVPRMAVGRVCLAADAAHLCNPFGGLGLTGGLVDIEGLFDCLRGIHSRRAGLEILEVYSDVRIQRWREVVDPVSQANIRRMFEGDPETDGFLDMCRRAETDVGLSRQMQRASGKLVYDFTRHYRGEGGRDGVVGDGGVEVDTEDAVGLAAEAVAS